MLFPNKEMRAKFVSSVVGKYPKGSWCIMIFNKSGWKYPHQEFARQDAIWKRTTTCCESFFARNVESYICPQAFSYGKHRTEENLYALQNIVIDIDCHSEAYCSSLRDRKIDMFVHYLMHDASDYGLPDPNHIVFTGRGLQIWWHHESMSAKTCTNTWKSVIKCFIEILERMISDHSSDSPMDSLSGLFVDKQASLNPVGVFRIPGTYNPKSKSYSFVVDEMNPSHTYSYKELLQFRDDYRAKYPIVPNKSSKRFQVPGYDWDSSDWAAATAQKIEMLRDLRDNDTGDETRNNFCLALYCLYRSTGTDDSAAMKKLHDFNDGFKRPMTDRELKSTLASARRKLYRYGTNAIIDLLDISDEECDAIGLKRKEEEPKPDREAKIKDRNKEIRRLYRTGLTQAEVAAEVGVSRKTVGDVLRNAGISRAGSKAKRIFDFSQKGLSPAQIADKIGCTVRNVYRVLQNAASKNAGGAPEAAQIESTDTKEANPTDISEEKEIVAPENNSRTINAPEEKKEKPFTPADVNAAADTETSMSKETNTPPDVPRSSPSPSVSEPSQAIPGSDFSSLCSEGKLNGGPNNGYLCRWGRTAPYPVCPSSYSRGVPPASLRAALSGGMSSIFGPVPLLDPFSLPSFV